jgi:hypothetical protein
MPVNGPLNIRDAFPPSHIICFLESATLRLAKDF